MEGAAVVEDNEYRNDEEDENGEREKDNECRNDEEDENGEREEDNEYRNDEEDENEAYGEDYGEQYRHKAVYDEASEDRNDDSSK